MENTNETTTDGLSRRQLLTRLGVGTTVVWAVPALVTIAVPAGAAPQARACRDIAAHGGPSCAICSDLHCEDDFSSFPCNCLLEVQRDCCFCGNLHLTDNCGGLTDCARNGQCAPGQKCVYTCCPITNLARVGKCVSPCPPPNTFSSAAGIRASSGNGGNWYSELVKQHLASG